jgi:outer membrane protein TolC
VVDAKNTVDYFLHFTSGYQYIMPSVSQYVLNVYITVLNQSCIFRQPAKLLYLTFVYLKNYKCGITIQQKTGVFLLLKILQIKTMQNLKGKHRYFNPLYNVKYLGLKQVTQPIGAKIHRTFFLFIIFLSASFFAVAQNKDTSTLVPYLTLQQCIDYALQNQPALKQSIINVSIAQTTNKINLSGWLPQVGLTGNLTHYIQLPTSFINTNGTITAEKTGVINTAIPGLGITQAIFTPELAYAAKSANLFVKQAEEITDSTKINVVSSVSQSFYNLLLTFEQIGVLKEDTALLVRSLNDAYHQYIGGIVDQTDYKEAAITLNNTEAQLKQAVENLSPEYANLKQLMGFPLEKQFNVSFDTAQMLKDIAFDTTEQLQYEKRIEYKQLQTEKSLQHQLINYWRLAFLPTVSAFYNYNDEYENNTFSKLFETAYPNSLIGLQLDLPIFTGFNRLENLHKAKLQDQLLDWNAVNLKSQIYSDYATSLANYKGNLYNFYALRDNVAMAKDVYGVVSVQYKQGIVAYLNVITAQSNLITSEINYVNALFQVLSSKIDLEKAMGDISY